MQLEVGSVVEAKITGITNFGAFAQIEGGKTGLIHISEIAVDFVKNIEDFVKIQVYVWEIRELIVRVAQFPCFFQNF